MNSNVPSDYRGAKATENVRYLLAAIIDSVSGAESDPTNIVPRYRHFAKCFEVIVPKAYINYITFGAKVAFIEAQRDFVAELGFPQLQPAPLGCDNSAVVSISNKASAFKRSLYLYRRADFVLKSGERKKIKVHKISTDENVSDVLTKVLTARKFKIFRRSLLNHHHMAVTSVRFPTRKARVVRYT